MSRTLGVARCQCCGEEDLPVCIKCLTRAHQLRGNVAVVSTTETTKKEVKECKRVFKRVVDGFEDADPDCVFDDCGR